MFKMGCRKSKEEREIVQNKPPPEVTRILLLGITDSGKTTLRNQMSYAEVDVSTDVLENYKSTIRRNLITCVASLIKAMDILKIDYDSLENMDLAMQFMNLVRRNEDLFRCFRKYIRILLNDSGIQRCCSNYHSSSYVNILDSADYLILHYERIISKTFVPTKQDVFNMRVVTCGVIETRFRYSDKEFTFIDVGGQRSQRRKWIHCFDVVDAMIYLVAINQYDKGVEEDNFTNKLHESMRVFSLLANNPIFAYKSVILFLNKMDLFKTKIKAVPLSVCFPHYKGKNTPNEASAFILKEFEQIYYEGRKKLYSHFTCATDTENVRVIFRRTTESIARQNLSSLRLM